MVWSVSDAKTFDRCPRQWFFKNKVANAIAKKDPRRREAYLLSRMDSLAAWRGRVVEQVIDANILPVLQGRALPDLGTVLSQARQRFETQLEYALEHRVRQPGFAKGNAGEAFAALRDVEFGQAPDARQIASAWEEVERALTYLIGESDLLQQLMAATWLAPQRTLHFKLDTLEAEPLTVRCVPDLIAFYWDRPPLIVDWKVHTFGTTGYRMQLLTYALALSRDET